LIQGLIRGRLLEEADDAGTPFAAVINDVTAA
jgi:hypothetical protein